jgi:type IV pilus assembly protein PilM
MNTGTYFYHDKPLFGLDIGFSSMKVMQIEHAARGGKVYGYGVNRFDPNAVKDGVIQDHEAIAKSLHEMFETLLVGDITTRRVALTVPAARSFSRAIRLPRLDTKDLADAVRLEAEQYIPVPIDDLYIDYDIVSKTDKEMELYAVAIPRRVVDSYMKLMQLVGLEVVAIETTIASAARLFEQSDQSDVPTILIDFGSISTDITIYDRTLVVTGTVAGGGDSFTQVIADKLGVTRDEATIIKTKYGMGLSKKQVEINQAIAPIIDALAKEIRRMIRYYEERSGTKQKISQIVSMGGGANMPGISDYLTNVLRLPARVCDPWQHFDFGRLQPPSTAEKSMYVTVAGSALLMPKEIFK